MNALRPVLVMLFTPLLALAVPAPAGQITVGGPVAPDGATELCCDLPAPERIHNVGSQVDGAGMCVMSSVEMGARYANLEELRGLRDWCAKQPGGAYPAKVDRQLAEFCRARGVPVPEYAQDEGLGLDTVRAVLQTGRIACVTYDGRDGVRYRGRIAHMVCVVHCDEKYVCVLDNNAVGDHDFLWMTPAEFESRFRGGGGWAFFWTAPPPPPPPHN